MFNNSVKSIKNVILYTRVSTEEQVKGFSLDAQLNDMTEYCNHHGYSVIAVYTDEGITGKFLDCRDEMKRLLRHVKLDSSIDAVVIWRSTRIARNLKDLTQMISLFEQNEVALISITENIDTSTYIGKYFSYFAGIMAEMEGNSIVIQSKNGMLQRAKDGLWNGGIVLGYDILDKKLIINEDEANTVRKIFQLYTEESWGYCKITKFLNAHIDQYPTKRKSTWSYFTVKNVLDNPLYAGFIRWNQHVDWTKKRRKLASKEVIKTDQYTYMLSGLLKCHSCGASMVSQRVQKKKRGINGEKEYYRYYICNAWTNKRICLPNLVNAEVVESEVIKKIKEFYSQPDITNIIASQFENSADDLSEVDKEIKMLLKKLNEKKVSEKTYYSYLANPEKLKLLKEEIILEMIQSTSGEISSIEANIQELTLKKESLSQQNSYLDAIVDVLNNFTLEIDNAPDEVKRRLLHSLIKQININPGKTTIERTISEIVLHFNSMDLEAFNKTEASKKIASEFEVTYDTVPL